MPEMNDLLCEGDEKHGWIVYRRVQVNKLQHKRGEILGHVKRLQDGTYEPSGMGAMFGHPEPANSLKEALEAFVGWD